jgi:RHS repeat-associated protein
MDYDRKVTHSLWRRPQFDYIVNVSEEPGDYINAYWNPHNLAHWAQFSARRLDSVWRRTVSNGSTTYAATEFGYDNPYTTGNPTAEKRWDSVKSPSLPALGQLASGNSQLLSRTFDSSGNPTDVCNPAACTHITYDAFGNLVTGVYQAYQTGAQRSLGYTWLNGVALGSKTDVDNGLTTSYTYDIVGRPLTAIDSTGGTNLRLTVTSYDDINRKVTTTGDLRSYLDAKLQTVAHFDQLGRVKLVQKSEGSPLYGDTDGIKVTTNYTGAGNGRRVVASSPYRDTSDSTLEWTCTQYDPRGRLAQVAMFKGSIAPASGCGNATNRTGITGTVYDAEWTVVTDPAGKVRKQRRDALGRIVEVVEDPSGLNYSTTYTYDPLDNLVLVTQGAETRSFAYSSLSRLTAAWNPESGITSYTYYDSGDLRRRTDARGVWSESTYDGLHQVLTKNYSDGTPPVTYTYHGGHLTSSSSSAASSAYGYSPLGNVTASSHSISGYPYNLTFTYDWYLNGRPKSMQYPSGRLVTYDVDDAGRSNKVYMTGKTYADMTLSGSNLAFTADGRISQMKLGNNRWETRSYNTPGTATVFKLGTAQSAGDLLQLEYNFSGTGNNGNLLSHVILRPGYNTWQQTFIYDGVNRLSNASESAGFNRTYGYDQYGNRWVAYSTGLQHSDPREPVSYSDFDRTYNTNRTTKAGALYDAAGNQTFFNPYTLTYDAENRNKDMTSSSNGNGTFAYDGEGRRVKKVWTPSGGTAATTYYFHDGLGRLAAEYSSQAPTGAGTSYLFTDMLGSVRAITSDSGSIGECYDYLPFGRMLSASDNGRNIGCFQPDPDTQFSSRLPQKFTGKERDAETGLDYFGARYFSAPQGRFTTPDPLMASAKISNPQTWNRYSYTLNNPLRFVDPDGLEVPDDCVNDPECKIKVSINVIYDKNSFRGKGYKGFTDSQKKEFEKDQLEKAKKDFGKSNIVLDVKYTEGEFDKYSNKVTGIDSNSINIVVMSTTPSGAIGDSTVDKEGSPIAFIDADNANTRNTAFTGNTTEHELSHIFLGDVYGHRSLLGNITGDIGINFRLNGQSVWGNSQQDMREGLGPRRYAVPMNPEANKPSQK